MKKQVLGALALGMLFGTPAVFAQTCASPIAFDGVSVGGDTCASSDSVALYCGALDSSGGKKDVIYTVSLAAEGSPARTATQISVTGGAAGFTPTIILYSAACNTGDSCAQTGEAGTPLSLAGVAAGNYFLAVTAGSSEAASACGTYTLAANGTLPVKLQKFSVN